MKRIILLILTLVSVASFSATVVTNTQVNYTITSNLLRDTGENVVSLYGTNESMVGNQYRALLNENYDMSKYKDLRAVVDLRSTWPEDYLYEFARRANINTIEIDSTYSYQDKSTLALSKLENMDDTQLVWMNLNNLYKMCEIVGHDLKLIFPDKKEIIEKNLTELLNKVDKYKLEFSQLNLEGVIINRRGLEYFAKFLNVPYAYVDNIDNLKNEPYDVILTSRPYKKDEMEKIKAMGKKVVLIQTGEFATEDENDEDLMSKDGLFTQMQDNLDELRKVEVK